MLNEWSPVLYFAPDIVVNDAETDHDARHQHAIIHVFCSGRRCRGPKAPENNKEDVETCEAIVDCTKITRYAPGASLKWRLYDFIVIVFD